eukprot:TRINITY_DN3850_c0_g1_i1.p1 TRINITY_DN3850_c0_g1~~TRINITY_DN3850_c0_g1_i1.p1  ORF type:complete len:221 (-),score=37.18 TRINITY_DN3850_c0_g1_i1:150-812(-)
MRLVFAYLHGFGSSPKSKKGVQLQSFFKNELNLQLYLPDLNNPSFSKLTYTGSLRALDELDAKYGQDAEWCLIGSSMGGYLSALWSSLHPDRVHKVMLLCPAFSMVERWAPLLGKEALEKWRITGTREFLDHATGLQTPLHYEFFEDSQRYPATPVVPCKTLIIHGKHDESVPIEFSRKYIVGKDNVELKEVEDDHLLAKSVPFIEQECVKFFDLKKSAL